MVKTEKMVKEMKDMDIELLYQGYDFTGAFAVSAILVLMAVVILVLRSVLENKGKTEGE